MFHIRLDGLAGHHIPLHAQDPGHFMDQRDPLGFSSHQIIRPFRNFFGQFLCRPAHKFHIPQDDEPGNGKRRGNRKNRQPARASGYFQFVKTVSHIFLPPPAKALLSTGKSPLASAWKDLSTGSCPQGCGQAVDNSFSASFFKHGSAEKSRWKISPLQQKTRTNTGFFPLSFTIFPGVPGQAAGPKSYPQGSASRKAAWGETALIYPQLPTISTGAVDNSVHNPEPTRESGAAPSCWAAVTAASRRQRACSIRRALPCSPRAGRARSSPPPSCRQH